MVENGNSASTAIERPRKSLALLKRLRMRHRWLRNMDAALRLGVLVLLLFWGTFLIDWFLELPTTIRLFHLVVGGLLMVAGARYFVLGFRRPLTDERLVVLVEKASPDFRESVLTAVQLTEPGNPRTQLYSPALLERTVRLAEERVEGARARDLLSKKGVVRSFLVLAFLVGTVLSLAVVRADLVRTYVSRDLLLSDEPWPREHWYEIADPAERELLMAMGDPLMVRAIRERGRDVRVYLETQFVDGERETFTMEKKGNDEFRKLFRNVSRDFSFRLEAGDFTSQEYLVKVRHRPRIETVALSFDYPEYTGLTDAETPTANLGGHIRVPVGTVVEYVAETSIPVQSATFNRVWREANEDRSFEAPVASRPSEVGAGSVLAGTFEAKQTGFYFFSLASEDGFVNPNPIRYRISLIQDHAPSVHILKPGANREVSSDAHFPIIVEGKDDYGITESTLVFRTAEDQGDAQAEARIPLSMIAKNSREGEATYLLDLQEWRGEGGSQRLPVVENARIEYFAEAIDALGQIGNSRTYSLTIVRAEDLSRIIQDELTLVKERLEEALRLERQNRGELEELLGRTRMADGKLPDKGHEEARFARLKQEKINLRLEDNYERLVEVVERVVENRLDSTVKELPWIEGLRDELGSLESKEAPQALKSLDDLAHKAADGVAGTSHVSQAVEDVREVERGLASLVRELAEWGDIRTMVRKLEDLIRMEQELENKVKKKITE